MVIQLESAEQKDATLAVGGEPSEPVPSEEPGTPPKETPEPSPEEYPEPPSELPPAPPPEALPGSCGGVIKDTLGSV